MDKKDELIIKVLGRKAGLSSRTLSKMLNLPISTVHRRTKRLEKEGVIKGYKALINFEKTPWPISAIVLLNLSEVIPGKGHIPKNIILQSLKGKKEIEEIIEVEATDFDIITKVRITSLSRLSEFIEELRCIEGIEEIKTAIITGETIILPKIIL